ncbi:prolipoprotein diacylglyceryl transferase [Aeoliella mucimassa]|uniref:Phosphatidylglycerol--prolipoprotein diacylglyceryl transferase n=1 Tax=Aeoliella mucimassa TaxID=2527972 RepID=A0A518AHR6_9BACT|nr:prolipoprotein diacylglyceryl transferase family protein [Aeoliella mucimassa]QDU54262.1 Prolipoprotein diacylglyceryl transferase [Aeoliella mucimassa]
MCTNLFIVPSKLFGIPLFGVGLLLALLVVVTAVWAAIVWRRPNGKAEVFGALPVLGIVALGILFMPRVFPSGFPVRGYGVMLVAASAAGLLLAYVRMKQAGLNTDLLFSLTLTMFVLGIAGGRLFYVIEYWERVYAPLPLNVALVEALKYANGGLVVYGALFGATVAFVWFTWRHKLPMLAMADLLAPSLLIGLSLGRIGCLLNGCCFGGVVDLPWAVTFPQEGQMAYSPPYGTQLSHGEFFGMYVTEREGQLVISRVTEGSAAADAGIAVDDVLVGLDGYKVSNLDDVGQTFRNVMVEPVPLRVHLADKPDITLPAKPLPARSLPVHPTQIYSSVNAGLMAWLLWSFYPARRRDGEVFALMITLYPIARFLLEMIRIDEASFLGTGLSISQNVSLLLLASAGLLWLYLSRQPRQRVFDAESPAALPA